MGSRQAYKISWSWGGGFQPQDWKTAVVFVVAACVGYVVFLTVLGVSHHWIGLVIVGAAFGAIGSLCSRLARKLGW